MFALEVDFHDGISPPETILVRRSHAVVGSSEVAHVVIEGGSSRTCELSLSRSIGRSFSCQPVRIKDSGDHPSFLGGLYLGEVEVSLGDVTVHATSIDVDLLVMPGEYPDQAGARVLRKALRYSSPMFPAVAVLTPMQVFVSFQQGEAITVGRSRDSGLRLDAGDVSAEQARIGFEEGQFWVEDLASTNGTFVGEERVSGRRFLEDGDAITVGSQFILYPVASEADLHSIKTTPNTGDSLSVGVSNYPCITSFSEVIRPHRHVLSPDSVTVVGRDPANEIWVGAVHVSRAHVKIEVDSSGYVTVTDSSVNGTLLNGEPLEAGIPISIQRELSILDLGDGLTLAICSSQKAEQSYLVSIGITSDDSKQVPLLDELISDFTGVLPRVTEESDFGRAVSARESMSDDTDKELGAFRRLARRSGNRAATQNFSASQYESIRNAIQGGGALEGALVDGIDQPSLIAGVRLIVLSSAVMILVMFVLLLFIWLFAGNFFIQ
jgi:pSer/pThr/pTyr-binding forkhead associated (FHA) protein